MSSRPEAEAPSDIIYPAAVPFALVHLSCILAIWTGVSVRALVICVALYWLRIFAIGAGYHRYFSHKSYSTGRVFQFLLAFLCQTTAQNSVLWWASKHRHHHLHSDTEDDAHSALHRGFFYSHVGWIFDQRHRETDMTKVEDLAAFPEIRWLHRFELVPAAAMGTVCFFLAGWSGVVVGYLWSTVLVYHSTFCINSLAHIHGKRRYVTGDGSRNNWLLAFFTMGEGWHNNHHAYQSSVRQGFRWWEVDPTFYILWGLSKIGVVWDLKSPPKHVLRNEHRLGARVVERAAAQLAVHFDPEAIARAVRSALHGPELSELQHTLASTLEGLANLRLPEMPRREDVQARAKAVLAETRSLDEIVDRAYDLLLKSVGVRLVAAA